LRACHLPHAVKAPVSLLRTPPLSVVAAVVDAIQAQGAVAAVGSSGLPAALGPVGRVRDWDVTTDAETETVEAALRATGPPVAPAPAGEGSYATRARFVVPCADHDVDVLVGFALRDNRGGVVPLPARVTRTWSGLPIADPDVWLRAHRLLQRHDRVDLLQHWHEEAGPPVTGP